MGDSMLYRKRRWHHQTMLKKLWHHSPKSEIRRALTVQRAACWYVAYCTSMLLQNGEGGGGQRECPRMHRLRFS
jgi:hypothetical protein